MFVVITPFGRTSGSLPRTSGVGYEWISEGDGRDNGEVPTVGEGPEVLTSTDGSSDPGPTSLAPPDLVSPLSCP